MPIRTYTTKPAAAPHATIALAKNGLDIVNLFGERRILPHQPIPFASVVSAPVNTLGCGMLVAAPLPDEWTPGTDIDFRLGLVQHTGDPAQLGDVRLQHGWAIAKPGQSLDPVSQYWTVPASTFPGFTWYASPLSYTIAAVYRAEYFTLTAGIPAASLPVGTAAGDMVMFAFYRDRTDTADTWGTWQGGPTNYSWVGGRLSFVSLEVKLTVT